MAIRKRSEVVLALEAALNYVAATLGTPPQLIHSDNAKEYLSAAVKAIMSQYRTQLRTTIPHNPEENGIAERLNRTLMNGVRCILETVKIGHEYWPYAIQEITFKHSLLAHSTTNLSPYTS